MKKIILSLFVITSVITLNSCRQDDDFNADELARLELLKKAREGASATTDTAKDMMLDGEPIPPPRK